jgi:hypothetical protein
VAPNIRDDLQRIGATGQHSANGPHQRPKFLQASNRITCALPQGCHKHVAHGVSGQFTIAGEAELQDVCPAPFPLVVGAQSRERHPQIARALGTTVERIAEAADNIGRLSPNPGGEFDPTGNPYILPDVVIERDMDGRWGARLTGEHLPSLRINDFYKDMIGKSGVDQKARAFLRDQIRDGLLRMSSGKTRGVDSLGPADLQRMPDEGVEDLAATLNAPEAERAWQWQVSAVIGRAIP